MASKTGLLGPRTARMQQLLLKVTWTRFPRQCECYGLQTKGETPGHLVQLFGSSVLVLLIPIHDTIDPDICEIMSNHTFLST